MKRGLTYITLIIMLSTIVLALGMSPPSSKIVFEPGATEVLTLRLFEDRSPFIASVQVYGDLEEYIEVDQTELTIDKDGTVLTITLTYPQTLKPGTHVSRVIIEEEKKLSEEGAGRAPFGARAALSHIVSVLVLDETKYAEASLYVPHTKNGETVNVAVNVDNFGKEHILSAQGVVTIYDGDGVLVTTLQTDERAIFSQGEAQLFAHWTPKDLLPGTYEARLNLTYDEFSTNDTRMFKIGEESMEVISISPVNISTGDIRSLSFIVKNNWNEPFIGAFLEAEVYFNDTFVETISTPPITIKAFNQGTLKALWDIRDYSAGEYELETTLHYAGQAVENSYVVNLYEMPPEEKFISYLLIGLIVLIALTIILIRRKKK